MSESVFIIVLNWNGWKDTIACIQSCQKLTYPRFQILVVDNASEDDSVKELRRVFPDLKILEIGNNLGFAGGNNIGIKYALKNGAQYIWLLNNDTIVDPETLTELIKIAELDTNIGFVGSKILTFSNPDILHFAGGKVNLQNGDTNHLGVWEKDNGQYDDLSEVDYVTGCSMLVNSSVIEKIGFMPEEYFLYYEETDWCISAHNAGYTIRMSPKSRVFHKISASIDYLSTAKIYYLIRNRLYFLQKHGKNVKWFQRILTDMKKSFEYFCTGRYKQAAIIIKGYLHWLAKCTGPLL